MFSTLIAIHSEELGLGLKNGKEEFIRKESENRSFIVRRQQMKRPKSGEKQMNKPMTKTGAFSKSTMKSDFLKCHCDVGNS